MARSVIMSIRPAIAAAALALVASTANAQQAAPDPTAQALAQMVAQGQEREATALTQAYLQRGETDQLKRKLAAETEKAAEKDKELSALRGHVDELKGKLAAETNRADEATAKLNGTEQEK